ncbi:hypothetical protein B0H10DRAFT_28902 [Mycena sp. CBHHK59/15]|nr:hypothetical protein B0H10DRAFT_28902 [Mycena sp. CBHHK59/15]
MKLPFSCRALLAVGIAICAIILFDNNLALFSFLGPIPHTVLERQATSLSGTYSQSLASYRTLPVFFESNNSLADVTAVVLNWARLPNVVRIVNVLCSDSLDSVIKEVVVWNNNNLRPLTYADFVTCNCSPSRLRIHNSPENLYFQARFIACSSASTTYCFIQDDDYLIKPEVIHSLRARVHRHDVFVLPPSEVLSSRLLSIDSTKIHFEFSWLGYGALILRDHAKAFLLLLRQLGASEEESKMADNYYSILKNSFPEIWIANPIELFGGHAFTAGKEGIERNRKHIAIATEYLDAIVLNDQVPSSLKQSPGDSEWPYVFMGATEVEHRLQRSPCVNTSCVLESTIKSYPETFATDTYATAGDIFRREAELSTVLTEHFSSHYIASPLSHAVDADPRTPFRSYWSAASGDMLVLDLFRGIQQTKWTNVQWAWLVDTDTAQLLQTATYSTSSNEQVGMKVDSSSSVSCTPVSILDMDSSSTILECHIPMETSLDTRYLRLQLPEGKYVSQWCIYETWARALIEHPMLSTLFANPS